MDNFLFYLSTCCPPVKTYLLYKYGMNTLQAHVGTNFNVNLRNRRGHGYGMLHGRHVPIGNVYPVDFVDSWQRAVIFIIWPGARALPSRR